MEMSGDESVDPLLDDFSEGGSEGNNSDHDGQDNGEVAAMVAGVMTSEVEGGEGIAMPVVQDEGRKRPLPFQAG